MTSERGVCAACDGSGVIVKKRPEGAIGPRETSFPCVCQWPRTAGGYAGQAKAPAPAILFGHDGTTGGNDDPNG